MAEIIRGVQMFGKLFRAVKGVLLKWIARGISRNDCVLGVRSLGKNSSRRWALREHLKGLGRSQVSKGMVRNRKRGELDEPSRPEVMVGGESELESQSRKTLYEELLCFFKKTLFWNNYGFTCNCKKQPRKISYTSYPVNGSFYFIIYSDVSSLLDIWFANTSSQTVICFFHLQKVDEIQFIIFSLYWLCFWYQV